MITVKGWWYSPRKTDWVAARSGKAHAQQGIEPIPDLVIKTRLPEAGPFSPAVNDEHAEIERKSKPHPKLIEFETGVRQAEKHLAKNPNRWALRVGFGGLLGIEYGAITQLLEGQGMEHPERAIVALAGACIFFYLTYLASKGVK